MTHHFINIFTYKYFLKNKENAKFHLDGFLLQVLFALKFHKWIKKNSGLMFYYQQEFRNEIYLTAFPLDDHRQSIVLPNWDSLENVRVSKNILEKLKKFDSIIIGISSPKQDFLAQQILKVYPEKNIYCLGAAIYTKPLLNSDNVLNTSLTMLFSNPLRYSKKVYKSLAIFISSIFIPKKSLIKLYEKIQ